MKKIILSGLLLLSWATHAQSRLSLKESIDMAVRNNLTVRQNELLVETADNNLSQSRMAMIPSLSGGASQAINWGRSIDPYTNLFVTQQLKSSNFNMQAGVPIFSGLLLRNSIKQNDLLLKASQQDVQTARDQVIINTLLAYLQVLSSEDQVELATRQVEASKLQLERTSELVKAGNLAPSDEFTLASQLSTDQLTLVTAQGQLKLNRLTFWQTLNNPSFPIDFSLERLTAEGDMGYATSATQIYESARQNLAVSKAADLRVQSAMKGIDVAKARLYPQLSANGYISTRYSSTADLGYGEQLKNNIYRAVSLDLTIPILNGWLNRTRVQNAVVQKKTAEVQAQNVQVQLKQGIEQAYANLEVTEMRYRALENQAKSFGETLQSAESRFQAGTLNVVEYNLAKTNYDRARLSLVQARYDYLFRVKILDYYQGKPLF
jgi:outer membrane protein